MVVFPLGLYCLVRVINEIIFELCLYYRHSVQVLSSQLLIKHWHYKPQIIQIKIQILETLLSVRQRQRKTGMVFSPLPCNLKLFECV